jgi:hypothetical protein
VEEQKLNIWIENFNKEINNIRVSLDAFFLSKKIDCYYNLKVDKEHNNLILEMNDAEELPNEILNRITDAYSKSKPE